ncbi:hypothetical protein SEA_GANTCHERGOBLIN_16 [Arthrobacter phage GantcherGoblin]|nr:hypothetical protein SEA_GANTCHERGOBLIN_16 [Arthrobacter phage GantcherGoblin]
MLTITIPEIEYFDDVTERFVTKPEYKLDFEHSLVSLSKWESIWEKPFLGPEEKTREETLGYMQCMCLTPNIPPEVFLSLSNEQIDQINEYISAKMTATFFMEEPAKRAGPTRKELVTSEVIYYWMISHSIPVEFEHWHLNRLITLIQVCNRKNQEAESKGKKPTGLRDKNALADRQRLNEMRKAQLGNNG